MRTKIPALLVLTAAALLAATSSAAGHTETPKRRGTIAFLREPPGASYTTNQSLYTVHADGSGVRRLTPLATPVLAYAWSPTDRLFAYIDSHDGSLWLVRPDGTGLRELISGFVLASSDLSWSPDGKKIAILSSGPYRKAALTSCEGLRVYVVPIHGSTPRRLRGANSSCDGIAWSPRGNEIAYGDGAIWVIHPNGSGRRQVSRHGLGWVRWSADGRQIAFGLRVGYVQGLGLYRGIGVVDAEGREFHVVTRNADNEYPAAWSPQGRRILYGRADNGGIYEIGADGRNDSRVTTDSPPGSEWPALAWSPDGGSIVYATPTGNGDLYVIGVDGRDKVQLTNTPDSDLAPSWVALTGRELQSNAQAVK